MDSLFGCHKCNALWETQENYIYPYSAHVNCPNCQQLGGVYFHGTPTNHKIVSADLGVNGLLNHADGKIYDNRSMYYKAIEKKDCHIIEGGELEKHRNPQARETRGDFNVSKELRRAIQQHLG